MDAPAEVTQMEDRTGYLHLPSAVLALIFIARRIEPSLSLVNRENELYMDSMLKMVLLLLLSSH